MNKISLPWLTTSYLILFLGSGLLSLAACSSLSAEPSAQESKETQTREAESFEAAKERESEAEGEPRSVDKKATPSEAAAVEGKGSPEWIDQLMEREVTPRLPHVTFRSPDKSFQGAAPARLASEMEAGPNGYALTLDIGSGNPMTCVFFSEDQDMASTLFLASQESFRAIELNHGPLEKTVPLVTHTGVTAKGRPYMAVYWLYAVKSEGESQAGFIKHALVRVNGRALYCAHDEVGYGTTFLETTQSLADSLVWQTPFPEPYYEEIHLIHLDDSPLGLTHETYHLDAEGDTQIEKRTSIMIPVNDREIQVSDRYSIQFSTPEGRLINAVEAEVQGEQLLTNLTLIPNKAGSWKVTGRQLEKVIDLELGAAKPLSSLGEVRQLRAFLEKAEAGESIEFSAWVPLEDPARFSPRKILVQESRESGDTVKIDTATSMEAILDSAAKAHSTSGKMGSIKFRSERLFQRGNIHSVASKR